jgi:hypothetical protein
MRIAASRRLPSDAPPSSDFLGDDRLHDFSKIRGVGKGQDDLRLSGVLNAVFDQARVVRVEVEVLRWHFVSGFRRYVRHWHKNDVGSAGSVAVSGLEFPNSRLRNAYSNTRSHINSGVCRQNAVARITQKPMSTEHHSRRIGTCALFVLDLGSVGGHFRNRRKL